MLLQPSSIKIIIRRDARFHEDLSAYKPDLAFIPSLAYEPFSSISY